MSTKGIRRSAESATKGHEEKRRACPRVHSWFYSGRVGTAAYPYSGNTALCYVPASLCRREDHPVSSCAASDSVANVNAPGNRADTGPCAVQAPLVSMSTSQ